MTKELKQVNDLRQSIKDSIELDTAIRFYLKKAGCKKLHTVEENRLINLCDESKVGTLISLIRNETVTSIFT